MSLRRLIGICLIGTIALCVVEVYPLVLRLLTQDVIHDLNGVAYYPLLIVFENMQITVLKLLLFSAFAVLTISVLWRMKT